MLSQTNSLLSSQLKKDESVSWYGLQEQNDEARLFLRLIDILRLVSYLLFALGAIFFVFGLTEGNPLANWQGPFVFTDIRRAFSNAGLIWLLAAILQLLRVVLPGVLENEIRTIYAVTNQRIMIVEQLKSGKLEVTNFGPGEVRTPSTHKNRYGRHDVLFVDRLESGGRTVEGSEREHIGWQGFYDVADPKGASAAIKEWIRQRQGEGGRVKLVNKQLGVEMLLPGDWTVRKLFLEQGKRDTFMQALIAASLDGKSDVHMGLRSDGEWNTLVLNRKGYSASRNDWARLDFYTIVVQGVISENKITGISDMTFSAPGKFQNYLDDPLTIYNSLNAQLLICEFDKLFDEKDKSKVRVNPKKNKTNLNNMTTWQMDGVFRVVGSELLFRQVYAYQDNVHMRYIVFGPGPEKERPFKGNAQIMNDIVKETRLLSDKAAEEKVQKEEKADPKRDDSNRKQQKLAKKEKPQPDSAKEPPEQSEDAEEENDAATQEDGPTIIQY